MTIILNFGNYQDVQIRRFDSKKENGVGVYKREKNIS